MRQQIIVKRTRVLSLLLEFLNSNYPDSYCTEDFLVDELIREVLSLPKKSIGKQPYVDYLIEVKLQ